MNKFCHWTSCATASPCGTHPRHSLTCQEVFLFHGAGLHKVTTRNLHALPDSSVYSGVHYLVRTTT